MKKVQLIFLILPILLASCATTKNTNPITRGEKYSKLYEEAPASILIMPPINNSNNVDAKEYFYTSLAIPLMEKGYYVFSPYLAMDLFQQESAYDSELFLNGDLSQFRNVFGADAALFTIINKWQKHSDNIATDVEYILVSTKTNEVLYSHKGKFKLDTSMSTGNDLFDLVGTLVMTVSTPIIRAARKCNWHVLRDLPHGAYSSRHLLDKEYNAFPEELSGTLE